jgi:DNA-binding SARP family transcriptional activator
LALCACARGITVEDVDAVLGPDGVARLDAFAVRQFVLREGDVYHGGLIAAALTRGRPAEVAAMRARCAAARSARGDHCGAAELWLAAGDAPRAAAALDAVGPPQPGVAVSSRYLRLLLAIPLEALLATQHAYVVMLTSPGVAANSPPLYAQARALAERSGANDRNLRVSTLLALAVFAYQASELRRAEELLERLQAEHERELFAPERAAVLAATWAAVASLRGRTVDAAARWDEAQLDAADGSTIYELQRLTLRIGIALSAGESRRLIPDVRRHIAMARASGDPIWIADARVYEAAITRMTVDDDLTTEMVLNAIEREELTAADPAAFRHITRAAELPNDARNILSCLALIGMAYAQHDAATARRMLASAISGLDRMGRTHYQILARLIAARIPGESTARLYEEARTLAAQVQDPRTAASVEAFAAGRMDEVACYPYAVKLVRKARFGVESALRVEILRGRVVRRSEQIALRSREYELLAALALAGTPLARAALATRLWGEDAAEDAGPALRTAVHRLRKQLDDPSALVFENGAYALGPTVTVDVQDIEATLSALRQLPSLTERERDQLRAIARDLAVDPPDVYGAWRWIQPHLAHILELRHRVTVLLAEDALAAGTPDEAVSIADVLLRIEPLDEPVVELAARGLLAAGRRRDAIRRARRYADDLARDLGGEPVSELLRSLAAGPTMAQVR